jgi:type IV secretion system protein VirB11
MSTRTLRHLLQPFEPFLADPTIEIVVNRPNEIGVETPSGWTWHEADLSYEHCEAIGILAAFQNGQDLSQVTPIVTATIPDGQRIHVNRPNATLPGIVSINIRQPSSYVPTLPRLADTGMFEPAQEAVIAPELAVEGIDAGLAAKLTKAVLERKNILLAGAVNTGKTTLAQALIAAIPMTERLITVEDTAEWNRISHRNRVALFYSKDNQGVSQLRSEQLLEGSLRMRPDRVLMGELRDGAAWTYLRGIVAGHPGCITTLHANSAEGAFNALRLMMRQHPEGKTMPDDVIEGMLREQIDIVVHLRRSPTTKRIHVTSVYEKPQ